MVSLMREGGFSRRCATYASQVSMRLSQLQKLGSDGVCLGRSLVHMIPQRIALELLLTGRPISAQRAHEIGFVNHVVPHNELMSRSIELAMEIACNAPLTVAAAKEVVRLSTEMGRSAAGRAAAHAFDHVIEGRCYRGPRAFREKREPVWKGK